MPSTKSPATFVALTKFCPSTEVATSCHIKIIFSSINQIWQFPRNQILRLYSTTILCYLTNLQWVWGVFGFFWLGGLGFLEGECLLLVLGWGFFVFKKKKIKKKTAGRVPDFQELQLVVSQASPQCCNRCRQKKTPERLNNLRSQTDLLSINTSLLYVSGLICTILHAILCHE